MKFDEFFLAMKTVVADKTPIYVGIWYYRITCTIFAKAVHINYQCLIKQFKCINCPFCSVISVVIVFITYRKNIIFLKKKSILYFKFSTSTLFQSSASLQFSNDSSSLSNVWRKKEC